MPRKARLKAWEALVGEIRARRDSGSDALPSIADLASSAGVSYSTMWKAVQRAAEQGAISVKPHRGIRLEPEGRVLDGPETGGGQAALPRAHKWRRVAHALGGDLYGGLAGHEGQLLRSQGILERKGHLDC